MDNFLDVCKPIQQRKGDGGAYNDKYNDWERDCLRKIVDTYGDEYDFLGKNKKQEESQSLTKEATTSEVKTESKSFSQNETIGIGAAAAVGGSVAGAGGLYLIPMTFRWLTRFFG